MTETHSEKARELAREIRGVIREDPDYEFCYEPDEIMRSGAFPGTPVREAERDPSEADSAGPLQVPPCHFLKPVIVVH